MKTSSVKHNMGGFTLVEILVAATLLIFGLSTTAYFSRTITKAGIQSRQYKDALQLAQNKLERLRGYGNRSSYDALAGGSESVTTPNTTYSLVWTVTTNTTPPYKVLQVQNSWSDVEGISRKVELTTVTAWSDPLNGVRILQ
ncbi:MAG: type II secretion system protein [Magnetococcales bacterium]|nr:type II secretion system protein [Magnetococcales bacterium]NGZ28950.1 type II secretion system protein [Magnetococcales bacterium]